ncbi:MAG: ACT domain-containing protein [Halieaceae bacterium]|nr:ACT domain-containing protein [Halieaceae bacterium]
MTRTFIITFIGDDRPGLVEALSQVIAEQGGNWLESRLSQLAGKFAGLISVSLPADQGAALETALDGLAETGISVRVTPCDSDSATTSRERMVTLTVLGPDRPGIVREVSTALSRRSINVVNMETHVGPAAMSSELLFQAIVEASLPTGTDLADLHENLDQIADEMHMDITLEDDPAR